MERETVDCVVAGAGVVGLAIARALALKGREVIVLEATKLVGSETSSRNSEVIHAGIYYQPEWLKARFCLAGKAQLYAYLRERDLPHRQCGKILVASETQTGRLGAIITNAEQSGCMDLALLSKDDVAALEPGVDAAAGILSPSTGILDVHSFMLSLQGDLEDHGGVIAFESPAERVIFDDGKIEIAVGGQDPINLSANAFINSAGLGAIGLANNYENFSKSLVPPQYFAKGNYFSLVGGHPFSHLIYPVPEAAGLGIHLTLDMAGQARFGPDVEWVEGIDYKVDPDRAAPFYQAIRSYWPALGDNMLQPSYAGIRPKIQARGEAACDFMIQGPRDHTIPGLVNLFGIESPGLTSSLAIGDYVTDLLAD